MCSSGRDLDGTTQSLKGVESEKQELSSLTVMLQKSIEVCEGETKRPPTSNIS